MVVLQVTLKCCRAEPEATKATRAMEVQAQVMWFVFLMFPQQLHLPQFGVQVVPEGELIATGLCVQMQQEMGCQKLRPGVQFVAREDVIPHTA